MKLWNQAKGFTLLEILVVVAIILLVVGIALPKLNPGDQAKEARAVADFRILRSAIESYVAANNSIPPDQATLGSLLEGSKPQVITDYSTFFDPFSPAKPPAAYRYFSASSATTGKKYYVFASVGRDNTSSITGISNAGIIQGSVGDDLIATNGK